MDLLIISVNMKVIVMFKKKVIEAVVNPLSLKFLGMTNQYVVQINANLRELTKEICLSVKKMFD
jgi:hypothetical protein